MRIIHHHETTTEFVCISVYYYVYEFRNLMILGLFVVKKIIEVFSYFTSCTLFGRLAH